MTPRKVFLGFKEITSFYEQLIYVSKKNRPQVPNMNMLDGWDEYVQRKSTSTDTSDNDTVRDAISDKEISKRLSDLEKSWAKYHPFGKQRYGQSQNSTSSLTNGQDESMNFRPEDIFDFPGGLPTANNSTNSFSMPESIANQLRGLNADEMVHYQNMIDGMP